MPYYGVQNHIANRLGQRFTLGYPALSLEGRAELASSLHHHHYLIPVCPQEPERPGTQTISLKYIKTYVLIQGFICLLGVQEYGMEYRLPHVQHLLDQISLKVGGPFPTYHPETMQGVMLADHQGQSPDNDTGGSL